eukprot:TRINITY_DN21114_c0_g1_i1.p1 TRINITY_DN21114_c0_g1~~TRINITY_DN21114_c0_g1_i1.p1  ORF type:complete len:513 (-),score=62.01 TRINITY_DN21114_c0_g1_i1:14-1504(-)
MGARERKRGREADRHSLVNVSGKKKAGTTAVRLRKEYKGYCPLDSKLVASRADVEIRSYSSLSPEQFFQDFVRQRKPVVLKTHDVPGGPLAALFGLRGEAAGWAKPGADGTAALRDGPAGACSIVAELRSGSSAMFGQEDADKRRTTTLAEFIRELEGGSELGYVSTQPLPEDSDGCATALGAPHVLHLLSSLRSIRPDLLGKLAPVQYNTWIGRAADGSSSGLHHDFHDNLYIVIRGEKEFRLFSPRCVDFLELAGASRARPRLHENGLICYGSGIRDDGAPEAIVREWRRRASDGTCVGADRKPPPPSDFGSDDSDEAMLEDALNGAMDDSDFEQGGCDMKQRCGLPDSFSPYSTLGSSSSSLPSVPSPLGGQHITARLAAGDLLYLPASWFHEVISHGGGPGGHMALNLWMAPPHAGGTFEQPYVDNFWEEKFQTMCETMRHESHTNEVTVDEVKAKDARAATSSRKVARRRILMRIYQRSLRLRGRGSHAYR